MLKIFGIGLNKTGTTTLGKSLQLLGYSHSSYNLRYLKQVSRGLYRDLFRHVALFDSFEDWPYPLAYEQLDRQFPGSKFILTRRSSAKVWLTSLESHSMRTDPRIGCDTRILAYGWSYPQLNPAAHISRYESHLIRVRTYFQNRPNDFLEVCWEEDSSWDTLCAFLDKPQPTLPFPHENMGSIVAHSNFELNERVLRSELRKIATRDS